MCATVRPVAVPPSPNDHEIVGVPVHPAGVVEAVNVVGEPSVVPEDAAVHVKTHALRGVTVNGALLLTRPVLLSTAHSSYVPGSIPVLSIGRENAPLASVAIWIVGASGALTFLRCEVTPWFGVKPEPA